MLGHAKVASSSRPASPDSRKSFRPARETRQRRIGVASRTPRIKIYRCTISHQLSRRRRTSSRSRIKESECRGNLRRPWTGSSNPWIPRMEIKARATSSRRTTTCSWCPSSQVTHLFYRLATSTRRTTQVRSYSSRSRTTTTSITTRRPSLRTRPKERALALMPSSTATHLETLYRCTGSAPRSGTDFMQVRAARTRRAWKCSSSTAPSS